MRTASEFRQRIDLAAVYTAATMPLNIVPLLIGTLVARLSLAEAQAGAVMTAELLAMAIVAFALAPFGNRLAAYPSAVAGCIVVILASAVTTQVETLSALIATRTVSGAGAGLLLLVSNVLLARGSDPVKRYGTAVFVTAMIAVVLLLVLPHTAAAYGIAGSYGAILLLAVLALPFAWRVRATEDDDQPASMVQGTIAKPTVLALAVLALLLVQALQAAYYAFVERRADDLAIDAATVGMLLAVAYSATLLATGLATWLGERFGVVRPVAVGVVGHSLCCAVALTTSDVHIFYACVVVQGLFYFFSIPYQLSVGAHLDSSGRFAAAAAAMFFVGLAIGPIVGGFVIENMGFSTLAITVPIGTVVGALAFSFVVKRGIKNVRVEQQTN